MRIYPLNFTILIITFIFTTIYDQLKLMSFMLSVFKYRFYFKFIDHQKYLLEYCFCDCPNNRIPIIYLYSSDSGPLLIVWIKHFNDDIPFYIKNIPFRQK